jgi:hypothetical protein
MLLILFTPALLGRHGILQVLRIGHGDVSHVYNMICDADAVHGIHDWKMSPDLASLHERHVFKCLFTVIRRLDLP